MTSDLQIAKPQVTVEIDRNKASALGVSAQAIEATLYDAYGQRQVSTIFAPTNQYWVVMELQPRYQTDPSVLSLLYVRSATGALVPLNSVATLKPTVGPLAINHLGQLAAVTISFDLRPGVAIGDAIRRSTRRPPRCACRRRSPASTRAPRRHFNRRCAGWASCWCWRYS